MCIVYHSVGALVHVESELSRHHIYDFKSLSDILQFERDYAVRTQQVTEKQSLAIQEEHSTLKNELALLEEEHDLQNQERLDRFNQLRRDLHQKIGSLFSPSASFKITLRDAGLNAAYWITLWVAPFLSRIEQYTIDKKQQKSLFGKRVRFQYLDEDLPAAIRQSSWSELQAFSDKKSIIEQIKPFIYGAIGEQKVVDELRKLSDDFILINDFRCSFQPPLFNRREKDYIKSVQMDHVLVAPSGIFLIETKNWSQKSINNLELRSPVQQVKRTSFALFKLFENTRIRKHHWGERKIPIRNVIVFTGSKPMGDFDYTKILGLHELIGYVQYFTPCFTREEVHYMANYLLECSDRRSNCRLTV